MRKRVYRAQRKVVGPALNEGTEFTEVSLVCGHTKAIKVTAAGIPERVTCPDCSKEKIAKRRRVTANA
jgi:hypothetical protein